MKHPIHWTQSSFLALTLTLFNFGASAEPFPRGCEPKEYQLYQNMLILNPSGQQRLFVVHNNTTESIEIQRQTSPQDFMSPSMQVNLGPNSWSAIASDMSNLAFECHLNANDHTQKVNCGDYLSICVYPRAKFALSNMGNYWVSANKPQRDIINDVAAKGIYLHW